jgi:hypothetical protein
MGNRAQRRHNTNTVGLWTTAQVRALLRDESKKHLRQFVDSYNAVIALSLHDSLGFGKKRCERFMLQMAERFNALADDTITVEDINQTLLDEVGIVIK